MLRHSWVPSDGRLAVLQAYRRCNVFAAWEHTTGSPTIPIAHLDSGVVDTLPEFAAKLTLDAPVFNPVCRNSNVAAAVLAGNGANGNYGVAYSSPLFHSSCFPFAPRSGLTPPMWSGADQTVADAILRARAAGARVILVARNVNSYPATAIAQACQAVYNGGGLVVAPGGPGKTSSLISPAGATGVLAVGGVVPSDEANSAVNAYGESKWWEAQCAFGAGIQVAAPTTARGPRGIENGGTYDDPIADWGTAPAADVAIAAAIVAGIAQLVWTVNPGLTPAQVTSILTSCTDKSRAGWQFGNYYTAAGVGIIDAEKAVLKAKSLAQPTVVFPYLRIHGGNPYLPFDVWGEAAQDPGTSYALGADGVWRVETHGAVSVEAGGFLNGSPLSSVDLILDGATIYSGVPTSRAAGNLVPLTSHRNDYYDVRVVGRASSGATATRVYAADYAGVPSANSVSYAALTMLASPVVASATTVSGTRATGASVTVSASGAVVGAVSYPTGATWSCTVSSLLQGSTDITATASDGETASVSVLTTFSPLPFAAVFGLAQDAAYAVLQGATTFGTTLGATLAAVFDPPLAGSLVYPATLGAAQDAGYADQTAQAFGATLGATSDAEAMPALAPSWLARVVRSGLSWLAGPFQPFILNPETALEALATFGSSADARVDYATFDGFAVLIGETFDAAFGPAYLDVAAFPWTASAAFDAAYSDAPPREADTDLWPRRVPVGLVAELVPVHLLADRHPVHLRAPHAS